MSVRFKINMSEEREYFYSENDNIQAIDRYEEMIQKNEQYFFDVYQFEDIIDHYFDERKYNKALEAIEIAMGQHPGTSVFQLKKASILLENGKGNLSLRLLNNLEKIEPANEEVLMLKGKACLALGKNREALRAFNQALKNTVEDKVELLQSIAFNLDMFGQNEQAIKYLRQALTIEPENPGTLYNLSYYHESLKDYSSSIKYMNLYLDEDPFSETAWLSLAELYVKTDQIKEALDAYDFCLAIDEHFTPAYFGKAQIFADQGKYVDAITNYRDIMDIDDETEDMLCLIGECYEKMGDYERAGNYYKRAIKMDDTFPDAWYGLGLVYIYTAQYKQGIENLYKAISLDQDNAEYWFSLGNAFLKIQEYNKAEEAYRKVLSMDDKDYEASLNLSEVFYQQKEYTKAINVLITSYTENADVAALNFRLSAYYFISGQKDQGYVYFEKGLTNDYSAYSEIFKYFPLAKNDQHIKLLINQYKK